MWYAGLMTQNDSRYLFVYGTLMSGARHPMHDVLTRAAQRVGDGFVHGRLYDLGRYPGLVLSASADDKVFGEVYRLRDDGVLRVLDDYEGCGEGAAEPTEYVRRIAAVTAAVCAVIDPEAIIYNRDASALAPIASGRYAPRPAD